MNDASPDVSASCQALVTQARDALPQVLGDLVDVVPVLQTLTAEWHHRLIRPMGAPTCVRTCAKLIHLYNFRLWHTEDTARRPDAPDSLMAQCKRAIDADNQQRHNHIERLDGLLFTYLYETHEKRAPGAALHSETPGSLVDRLSILALKMYHMAAAAERHDATAQHQHQCRQRLVMLAEQRDDLWMCLCRLCVDLWQGRATFKIYRQFKMYNDPELNPEIYRHRVDR